MLSLLRNRFATPSHFESVLEPWADLRREIDRLFDSALAGTGPIGVRNGMHWAPPMDVEERDDAISLTVELPGVDRADVSITVENGMLTISGEKREAAESTRDSQGARFVERRYGRFERVLTLPQSVVADKISANYDNGVLTLELPKSAEARSRKIEIGGGNKQKRIESGEQGGRRVA